MRKKQPAKAKKAVNRTVNRGARPSTAPKPSRPPVDAPSTGPKTEGQRLLMCVKDSLATIGAACKASKQAVACWRNGSKEPGSEPRRLLELAYKIPAKAWGEAPGSSGDPQAAGVPEALAEGAEITTMAGCDTLLGVIRRERANRPGMLAKELVTLVDAEVRLLSLRHKLEKEAELLEDRIVKQHPMWARIRAVLGDVVAKYPEAAREFVGILRELDA